jgi:hypothetical protein
MLYLTMLIVAQATRISSSAGTLNECRNESNAQSGHDKKIKDKALPLQARSVPECSRKLRFPDFLTTAQDGGKIVSLTHRRHPGNTPGTHFC